MKSDMKKKLLLLGGSSYLLPVIEKAHALGLHVITCGCLPDNAAASCWPPHDPPRYGIIRGR